MGALELGYCTFGLANLDILDAIDAVAQAGYPGIEISFHRRQLNPFNVDDDDLRVLHKRLQAAHLVPVCVATASYFFTPSRPHEPSLMSLDLAGRKRRIDLIKRGIRFARRLGAPLVTFGSGFLREEHVSHSSINPYQLLIDSIEECLQEIHDDGDITLLIEPEPGMLIETLDQGLALIKQINSQHFMLHVDICHAYCTEKNYIDALATAAPSTRYLHVSDARPGYNLKIETDIEDLTFDLDAASTLVYFPDTADYLLVDRDHPLYFYETKPSDAQRRRIEVLLTRGGVQQAPGFVDYSGLYAGPSPLDDEIFTYLISVPKLSYEVLERAGPVIAYLRGARNRPLVEKRVANTRTGIVHFHEIPGEGTLNFPASFNALTSNGFTGYASVELYHHLECWQHALWDSYRYLARFTGSQSEIGPPSLNGRPPVCIGQP